jgi:hypothetical protein
MRTTFSEIRLFNDDLFQHETSFIFNGKEWGIGNGGGRMREKECARQRVGRKGCGVGHIP